MPRTSSSAIYRGGFAIGSASHADLEAKGMLFGGEVGQQIDVFDGGGKVSACNEAIEKKQRTAFCDTPLRLELRPIKRVDAVVPSPEPPRVAAPVVPPPPEPPPPALQPVVPPTPAPQASASQEPGPLTFAEVDSSLKRSKLSYADKLALNSRFNGQRVRWMCTLIRLVDFSTELGAFCRNGPGLFWLRHLTAADADALKRVAEGTRLIVEGTVRTDDTRVDLDAPVVRFDLLAPVTFAKVAAALASNASDADKLAVASRFKGKRVRWTCTFHDLWDDSFTLRAYCDDRAGSFYVNNPTAADTRALKRVVMGKRLVVEGTVDRQGRGDLDAPVVRFDLKP